MTENARIEEFLKLTEEASVLDTLTPEQEEYLSTSIAVLTDIDPYFVKAANFQPKELAVMFQRVAALGARLKEIEKDINPRDTWFGPDTRFHQQSPSNNGFMLYLENNKLAHATTRESLGRLAQSIIERARIEKTPKP